MTIRVRCRGGIVAVLLRSTYAGKIRNCGVALAHMPPFWDGQNEALSYSGAPFMGQNGVQLTISPVAIREHVIADPTFVQHAEATHYRD